MEHTLKYISKTLIQQGNTVSSPGLLHGKMGLVIFFFHYAQFTGNKTFEEEAFALIDHIQEDILHQQNIEYADGLAGIGAGIEYLSQNGFVDANTDEILSEFDQRIFQNIVFNTRLDGKSLSGLGRYLLFRIHNKTASDYKNSTLSHKMWLIHIVDLLEQIYVQQENDSIANIYLFLNKIDKTNIFPTKVKRLIKVIKSNYSLNGLLCNQESYRKFVVSSICRQYDKLLISSQVNSTSDIPLHLLYGFSGIGLYLMGLIDCRHKTWFQLL